MITFRRQEAVHNKKPWTSPILRINRYKKNFICCKVTSVGDSGTCLWTEGKEPEGRENWLATWGWASLRITVRLWVKKESLNLTWRTWGSEQDVRGWQRQRCEEERSRMVCTSSENTHYWKQSGQERQSGVDHVSGAGRGEQNLHYGVTREASPGRGGFQTKQDKEEGEVHKKMRL